MNDLVKFDYGDMPRSEVSKLNALERYAKEDICQAATKVMELGRRLKEAQELLAAYKTGGFGEWIETCFPFSRSTAYNRIAEYERFGNCPTVGQIEDGARTALASKRVPEKAVQEAVKLSQRQTVTQKIAKAIIEKFKPAPSTSTNSPKNAPKTSETAENNGKSGEVTSSTTSAPGSGKTVTKAKADPLPAIDKQIEECYGKLLRSFDARAKACGGRGPRFAAVDESMGAVLSDFHAWQKAGGK